jgi:uncharacterized membrane protein
VALLSSESRSPEATPYVPEGKALGGGADVVINAAGLIRETGDRSYRAVHTPKARSPCLRPVWQPVSAVCSRSQPLAPTRAPSPVTTSATAEEQVAEAITRFTGSMRFVYLHLAFFGFWILANLGWVPGVPAWDPSFVVLAMIASVEAIFLSTFVLISQNRMAAAADKRADLNLQVSLLAEHEVTRLVTLVSGIADRIGVKTDADADLEEITRDVAPEAVLDELEETEPGAEQH